MGTLSGCTIVRNAVKLNYPLEASILTYYPISDEVIVAYDPRSEDETEAFVRELARKYPKVRPVPSAWNMENHAEGTEITIQSNVAVEACTGDWILYVQADEAIHEGDHAAILETLRSGDANALLFDRWSFLWNLESEIPEYFARNLLRLFRNGEGCVVGDGMTCGLFQGIAPAVPTRRFRMFNYSRMGSRDEILLRSRSRDNFHISTKEGIEKNLKLEFKQTTRPYDAVAHPSAIRRFYSPSAPSPTRAVVEPSFPVALAFLLGPGERENLAPFLWQFRGWPGEVLIFDDMTEDGAGSLARHFLQTALQLYDARVRIVRAPLEGDFAGARNRLQEAARSPWVLTSAPDERWDEGLLRNCPSLIAQLERDRKLICGFPRANFVDGVLVNDIPDSAWTEEELLRRHGQTSWPPRNPDVQYRLLRREERWEGRIHERPRRLVEEPGGVVVLSDFWILHNKTFARQRRQDAFYKSLGQRRGMPEAPGGARAPNLRASTLSEVLGGMPAGPVVVVETGTLRDPSPEARLGDGWSTFTLAQLLSDRGHPGSRLYSIDISPENIEVSRRTVPASLHRWVSWVPGDARQALATLEAETIDLLYLDSSDDPAEILAEFQAALPKFRPGSVVIVDDTGPYHAGPDGKGTLLLPFAERNGWKVARRDDERSHMSILSKEGASIGPGRPGVTRGPAAERAGLRLYRGEGL